MEEERPQTNWSMNGVTIAKTIAVATLHKPATMNVNSSHIYFFNYGQGLSSLKFHENVIQKTEDVCIIEVNALDDSELVLKAQFCFCQERCESVTSQCHMPATPIPKYCLSLSDALNNLVKEWEETMSKVSEVIKDYTENIKRNPINSIFDIRVVDGESFTAAAMKGFFTKLWARANKYEVRTVEKNLLFATYFVETTLIPSMLRCHMSRGFSPTQIIPVDFCCWFHSNDFTVNDWLLCENHFSITKNGRAFIEHHLWTIKGDLIMTANSETIVKGQLVASKNAKTIVQE